MIIITCIICVSIITKISLIVQNVYSSYRYTNEEIIMIIILLSASYSTVCWWPSFADVAMQLNWVMLATWVMYLHVLRAPSWTAPYRGVWDTCAKNTAEPRTGFTWSNSLETGSVLFNSLSRFQCTFGNNIF